MLQEAKQHRGEDVQSEKCRDQSNDIISVHGSLLKLNPEKHWQKVVIEIESAGGSQPKATRLGDEECSIGPSVPLCLSVCLFCLVLDPRDLWGGGEGRGIGCSARALFCSPHSLCSSTVLNCFLKLLF